MNSLERDELMSSNLSSGTRGDLGSDGSDNLVGLITRTLDIRPALLVFS